jgi:hypothetical protein
MRRAVRYQSRKGLDTSFSHSEHRVLRSYAAQAVGISEHGNKRRNGTGRYSAAPLRGLRSHNEIVIS